MFSLPWFQEKKPAPRQVGQRVLQILTDELRRRGKKIAELEAEIERLRNEGSE